MSKLAMFDIDFSALGKDPISPANPPGQDIRYEPDFEWLEKEIAKLSQPEFAAPVSGEVQDGAPTTRVAYAEVDWNAVVHTASRVLKSQSKDFRVAVWLSRALMELEGWAGLAGGLDLCFQLVSRYWEKLYPNRLQGKTAAMLMLRNYVADFLKPRKDVPPLPVSAKDVPDFKRSIEFISELELFVEVKLPGTSITFNLVKSALEEKLAQARDLSKEKPEVRNQRRVGQAQAEPAVVAPTEPPRPAQTPVPQAASAPGQGVSRPLPQYNFAKTGDRSGYLEFLQESARAWHSWALRENVQDPLPYRWIRVVYWLPLEYAPETPFPFPAPNEHLQKALDERWKNREWNDLLKTAETQFPAYWFWLDLQRYAIESMRNLGDGFRRAREAVTGEFIFLLRRMPFILNMYTRDGVPVASADTLEWAQEIQAQDTVRTITGPRAGGATGELMPEDGQPEVVFDVGDPISSNLTKARERLMGAASGRDRFVIQLKFAEYLLDQKEVILAQSCLDQADGMMAVHQLERWDPSLSAPALRLMHECSMKMARTRKDERQRYIDRARAIAARLAALDPVAAAAIMGESG